MYCTNCGKEIENNVVQCPYCDTPILSKNVTIEDSGSNWWGVLSCCFPMVGLILYIIWRECQPKCAKKVGIGLLTFIVIFVTVFVVMPIVIPILISIALYSIKIFC